MYRSKAARRRYTLQRLATGERRRVSARRGINGAPAWSPDGRRLALTLSRDGNLDLYVLDLASQGLTRLTTDESIDYRTGMVERRHRHLFHVGSRGQCTGVP
jgi:TolB protein